MPADITQLPVPSARGVKRRDNMTVEQVGVIAIVIFLVSSILFFCALKFGDNRAQTITGGVWLLSAYIVTLLIGLK